MKRIGDIFTRNKTSVVVEDATRYKQVTIRTNYKGVCLRGTQDGSTILTKNQFTVSAEPLLTDSECFDVFTDPSGEKLAADSKSVAYRFQYRAADRTLKAEEVDTAHQKVLEALTKSLGVKFR